MPKDKNYKATVESLRKTLDEQLEALRNAEEEYRRFSEIQVESLDRQPSIQGMEYALTHYTKGSRQYDLVHDMISQSISSVPYLKGLDPEKFIEDYKKDIENRETALRARAYLREAVDPDNYAFRHLVNHYLYLAGMNYDAEMAPRENDMPPADRSDPEILTYAARQMPDFLAHVIKGAKNMEDPSIRFYDYLYNAVGAMEKDIDEKRKGLRESIDYLFNHAKDIYDTGIEQRKNAMDTAREAAEETSAKLSAMIADKEMSKADRKERLDSDKQFFVKSAYLDADETDKKRYGRKPCGIYFISKITGYDIKKSMNEATLKGILSNVYLNGEPILDKMQSTFEGNNNYYDICNNIGEAILGVGKNLRNKDMDLENGFGYFRIANERPIISVKRMDPKTKKETFHPVLYDYSDITDGNKKFTKGLKEEQKLTGMKNDRDGLQTDIRIRYTEYRDLNYHSYMMSKALNSGKDLSEVLDEVNKAVAQNRKDLDYKNVMAMEKERTEIREAALKRKEEADKKIADEKAAKAAKKEEKKAAATAAKNSDKVKKINLEGIKDAKKPKTEEDFIESIADESVKEADKPTVEAKPSGPSKEELDAEAKRKAAEERRNRAMESVREKYIEHRIREAKTNGEKQIREIEEKKDAAVAIANNLKSVKNVSNKNAADTAGLKSELEKLIRQAEATDDKTKIADINKKIAEVSAPLSKTAYTAQKAIDKAVSHFEEELREGFPNPMMDNKCSYMEYIELKQKITELGSIKDRELKGIYSSIDRTKAFDSKVEDKLVDIYKAVKENRLDKFIDTADPDTALLASKLKHVPNIKNILEERVKQYELETNPGTFDKIKKKWNEWFPSENNPKPKNTKDFIDNLVYQSTNKINTEIRDFQNNTGFLGKEAFVESCFRYCRTAASNAERDVANCDHELEGLHNFLKDDNLKKVAEEMAKENRAQLEEKVDKLLSRRDEKGHRSHSHEDTHEKKQTQPVKTSPKPPELGTPAK